MSNKVPVLRQRLRLRHRRGRRGSTGAQKHIMGASGSRNKAGSKPGQLLLHQLVRLILHSAALEMPTLQEQLQQWWGSSGA
jgi:hypothetical protein